MGKSKLTVYELANDVSNQLHLLRQDIAGITLYLDKLAGHELDNVIDMEKLRSVYRQINSAESYAKTLYNEYQTLAAETINKKD